MNTSQESLARLEQSLRRMKTILVLIGIALILFFVTGAANPPQELLRVKTIHIVDDNGDIAAVFSSSGGCGELYLQRASDKARLIDLNSAILDDGRRGGVLRVHATGTKTPIELGMTAKADGVITLKNQLGWKSLVLAAREDGGLIDLLSGQVKPLTCIRIESALETVSGGPPDTKEQRSRIEVRNGQSEIRVRMDTRENTGTVETFDTKGSSDKMPHVK